MARRNYERVEFVLTVIFPVIAAADVGLIFWIQGTHVAETKEILETFHQVISSLFMTTIVVCSLTLLIRWYRHQHEMLEALKLSEQLVQENKVGECIREIIQNCSKIRHKPWPDFSEEILLHELVHFKEFTDKLEGGRAKLKLELAQRYSPQFFKITKGPSFVTAFGNWEYWKTEHGRKQLKSNKEVIQSKHGSITRVLILPTDNGTAPAIPPDDLIRDQIESKIELIVIHECDVQPDFRCDVGVFFHAGEKGVAFLSEWRNSDPLKDCAEITFEGDHLTFGYNVRAYFQAHTRACPIKDMSEWEKYRGRTPDGNGTKPA